MPTTQQQIEQLQDSIQQDQTKHDLLALQLEALRDELIHIKRRYEVLVLPHQQRLEAAQTEITKLEQEALIRQQPVAQWTPPEDYIPVEEQYRQSWVSGQKTTTLKEDGYSGWTPPDDYIPVEEQYRRKWTPHEAPKTSAEDNSATGFIPSPEPPPATNQDLKTLYRQLARHYHPDYAQDEADLVFRNQMMAQINEAYAQENIEALRGFFARQDSPTPQQPKADSALELQLKQLRIIQQRLRRQLFALKQQLHDLEHSDLMRLKHDVWLWRLQGRDLLQEMADSTEQEYQHLLQKLYRLRRER